MGTDWQHTAELAALGALVALMIWGYFRREEPEAGDPKPRDPFEANDPRWFTHQAALGRVQLEWRADLEALTLTLADTAAGNMHDVALESLQLRRADGGWQMRPTGEPSVELTQVLESALVADPAARPSERWYELPDDVAGALEEQYQRHLAKRAG